MQQQSEKIMKTMTEKDRFMTILNKNDEERLKKSNDDEVMKMRRRAEEERATGQVIREQIRAKEEARYQQLQSKQQGAEEPDQYNQYLQYQKVEKREHQKLYKEFLDRQQIERDQAFNANSKSFNGNVGVITIIPFIACPYNELMVG